MLRMIGQDTQPMICIPLVGKTDEEILFQLAQILPKQPDILEWRADYYSDLINTNKILGIIEKIKQAADISLIFTIRSSREGGQPVTLNDQEILALIGAICQNARVDYLDCELRNDRRFIGSLRDTAQQYGKKVIGSYHNFLRTPGPAEIIGKLMEAERCGLDVAKVAVMPSGPKDVLTLLSATLEAKQKIKIPLITMAMGPYGAISRLTGGLFGSALTFAVGSAASAPGQMPIEDVRTVLRILENMK